MQARLRNIVSNFQVGHAPPLRPEVPIWLLGSLYLPEQSSVSCSDASSTCTTTVSHAEAFCWDFRSRLWFTYRSNFPRLAQADATTVKDGMLASNGTSVTTDAGWGCMLRTGQMILVQAFMTMSLGRGWRLCPGPHALPAEYGEVLRWFADTPHPSAPYSIHHIASEGVLFGKRVGEWFEPRVTCKVLQRLVENHQPHLGPLRRRVRVYVTDDSRTVYADEVANMCVPTNSAIIVFVPLLLGLHTLNLEYLPQLSTLFSWPQFLGIAGGRPRSSMYFVGVQSSALPTASGVAKGAEKVPLQPASHASWTSRIPLVSRLSSDSADQTSAAEPPLSERALKHVDDLAIYLDPHVTRPAFPMECAFNSSSFHCKTPAMMPMSALDPSMALGFLCQSNAEWLDLVRRIGTLNQLSSLPPIFAVSRSRPQTLQIPASSLDVSEGSSHRSSVDVDYDEEGCLLGPSENSESQDDDHILV